MKSFKLLIILLFSSFFVMAQNTMYFMERMPQSIHYNPAIMPKMDFYLGLPGLSGVSLQAYNSGFNYNELDYFIDHILDANYSPDEFVNSIGNQNKFTTEANINLFSLGFRLKNNSFLSFGLQANSHLLNTAASDIAYLLTDLDDITDDDFPIIVDDISILINNYISFGATYSKKIDEHLTLGITPKINFNYMGLSSSDVRLNVELIESEFESDYETSLNGNVEVGLFTNINPDAINGNEFDLEAPLFPDNFEEDITVKDILKNKSLSIDLGATYELEKWTFSASILNLGKSTYKTNGYKLTGNGNSVLISENHKIKIGIPTRIYLGALRQFAPKWNYALLLNNNFYSTGSQASATVSLNGFVGSALSTSVSYTAGYKFDNFGLGLRMRFLPGVDMFMVTDNIIQLINSKNAHRLTMAFGINIAAGVKEKKEIKLPEIENLKF
ncbi:MAG: hypothetical protein JXR61_12460 [Prolixibacteraceae bacterium]|nr:hypothetical protein [Prolixibacteraceae bacterium]